MFFLSLETSTVALRTVLNDFCVSFLPWIWHPSNFLSRIFLFAFLFAFQRKFAPKIPGKFPWSRPFSLWICLFKSRKKKLTFFPANYQKPCFNEPKKETDNFITELSICHTVRILTLRAVMHPSFPPVPIPLAAPGQLFCRFFVPGMGHLCSTDRPPGNFIHVVSKPSKAGVPKLRFFLFLRDGGFRRKRYGFRVTVACPRRTR